MLDVCLSEDLRRQLEGRQCWQDYTPQPLRGCMEAELCSLSWEFPLSYYSESTVFEICDDHHDI